MLFSLALK